MFAVESELRSYAIPALVSTGYGDRLRPLDGKKLAFKERGPYTPEEMVGFMRRGLNLGLRLWDGLMVVDKDGENQGPFAELSSPMTVETSRGTHGYFQTDLEQSNKLKIGGLDIDVIFHGVAVIPPSLHPVTGWRYRFTNGLVKKENLPVFPADLLREFEKPRVVRPEVAVTDAIDRVRRYLQKIVAVEGQGGDRTTFRAACRAVEATEGNEAKALALLTEWNETNALPPWSEAALLWKVRSAIKSVFGR